MKRQVKNLPANAVYDFTDTISGVRHYHTDKKRYEVEYKSSCGMGFRVIYSFDK